MQIKISAVLISFIIGEAVLVYISILEQQGKFGAALEIISGDLGSLLPIEVDKYRIQVEVIFLFFSLRQVFAILETGCQSLVIKQGIP